MVFTVPLELRLRAAPPSYHGPLLGFQSSHSPLGVWVLSPSSRLVEQVYAG